MGAWVKQGAPSRLALFPPAVVDGFEGFDEGAGFFAGGDGLDGVDFDEFAEEAAHARGLLEPAEPAEEEVDEVAAEWAALVDDGPYKSGSVEFNYETSEGVLPVAFDIDEMTINVGENKAKIVASGATLKSVMPREDGNVKLTFSKWGFSKSKEVSSEKLREFVDKIAVGQPKEIALGEGAKLEMIA